MVAPSRVQLVRSGGFAGLSQQWNVDPATLDPTAAQHLDQLVAAVQAEGPAAPAPPSRGADRYQYDLQLVDADGNAHELTLQDASLTSAQRELVQFLLAQPS